MRCIRFKRVRVRGAGIQRRCAKYSGRKRPRSRGYGKAKRRASGGYRKAKRIGSYKRGHRPFNKGRRCVSKGVNRKGRVTCRSYGGRGAKSKGRGRMSSMAKVWGDIQSRQRANVETREGTRPPLWFT